MTSCREHSLNRKKRLLFSPLPGTNRATFTAVRSRISQPFQAALKEKWQSGLNPWCLFLDAVLSFEEIIPVKEGVGIKSSMMMSADFGI